MYYNPSIGFAGPPKPPVASGKGTIYNQRFPRRNPGAYDPTTDRRALGVPGQEMSGGGRSGLYNQNPNTAQRGQMYGDPARGGYIPYGTQQQGGYNPNAGVPAGGQSFSGGQGQNPNYPGGNGDRRYYDQARNDLMGRYDQQSGGLQGQYDKRIKDLSAMLKGYGNQELSDARQQGTNLTNQIAGSLTGRGLSGTTLMSAGQAMGATNMQNNLSRINERLQGQKVGLAERTTGDALGFGERAFQGGIGLGQQNIRDSRGDYENDRNFGEAQFTGDRAFGRGNYENDRNFNRGIYEDDRNFGNRNFEVDREFQQRKGESDRDFAMRRQLMQQDQQRYGQNRNDNLALEQLRFMERRNDTYPSLDQMYQLFGQAGQYA